MTVVFYRRFAIELKAAAVQREEMDISLTPAEARVLGALMEKEVTTPDHYPLTLNSLVSACNQRTSRHPVTDYDEGEIEAVIASLREKRLALRVDAAGSRVAKYRHALNDHLTLDGADKAILTVLLLRGPQTLGELRTRTERMWKFATLDETAETVESLAQERESPLVVELPRRPGQKERRFTQTMTSATLDEAVAAAENPLIARPGEADGIATEASADEVHPADVNAELRARVETLEKRVAELEEALEAFKQQFA